MMKRLARRFSQPSSRRPLNPWSVWRREMETGDQANPLKPVSDLVETLRQAISPFTDPVLGELGQYVAERVRFLRFKQTVRIAQRAQEIANQRQKPLGAVEPKFLVQVLESGALESDDLLIERWAGLLADAAMGNQLAPSYGPILSQLAPEDARILDYIIDHEERIPTFLGEHFGIRGDVLARAVELPDEHFVLRCLNLERLVLIEEAGSGGLRPATRYRPELGQMVALTRLGRAFVHACRGESGNAAQRGVEPDVE